MGLKRGLNMGLIKPKKLKQGDTIGVVAPSNWTDPALLESSVEKLRGYGFDVVVHPQCYARDRSASGTTVEKIQGLHEMFADPAVDAIFCARGGNRSLHLLDGLDYDLIAKKPKIVMGFSDITTLLSAFYVRAGLVGFHGLTLRGFYTDDDRVSRDKTLDLLQGNWPAPLWPQTDRTDILRAGEVEGVLYGGNLAMLYALLASGDAYVPSFDNVLLVIEDTGEEIRAIDRMFGALRLRGVFDRIAGLIVGDISDVRDTSSSSNPFNRSVQEVVMEHTAQMKGPVVMQAPIGHEKPNFPFPVGIKARLAAYEKGAAQIQLLESPFSDA